MAAKKVSRSKPKLTRKDEVMEKPVMAETPVVKETNQDDDLFGEKLDPAEEKMLDRILMAVVIFILAWLGLSILLVLRGYACSEWISGSFMCAGL